MTSLLAWMVRLGALLAGLLFFASLLAAGAVLLTVWLLRALWAKLSGQPVRPWVFQMKRHPPWMQPHRAATAQSSEDVIDAEVKEVVEVTDIQVKRLDE